MWEQVGKLHAYHGEVPVEVRLLKLTEEVGEAADAFLCVHRLNRRKGVCRTRDDLLDELADVIITAAVCWLTSRCGLMAVAQPLAGQGGGDLIQVDHPALKAPLTAARSPRRSAGGTAQAASGRDTRPGY